MNAERIVRIGGASGAWGDSPRAIPQLLTAPVDYLMMDYLAEVSMSLLARARLKAPDGGYPLDFIAYLKDHLASIAARGIKIVSNGGGVNPRGCAAAMQRVCDDLSLPLRIAAVEGDDVLPLIEGLRGAVREAVSGAQLPPRLLTANAYLGALPIRAALDAGADIVITGRCADSALALGILMHEFGWQEDEYHKLASGSLAGHLLECGAQGVGGLHTDWEAVPNWENIGYPIAECRKDGTFVLTKPAATGGLVTPGTVSEQALYEIGDPAAYILPDVVADFSAVRIVQDGPERVRVTGARGRRPTAQYKVSATYQDGYRAVASVSIVGPDAAAKAERTGKALIARARLAFREAGLPDFTATHLEALGAEASYGVGSRARASREVLLRLVVVHAEARCLELFARELGSVGISFAPGTTGIYGGRPKPAPHICLFTFFIDKAGLPAPVVWLDGRSVQVTIPRGWAAPVAGSAEADRAGASVRLGEMRGECGGLPGGYPAVGNALAGEPGGTGGSARLGEMRGEGGELPGGYPALGNAPAGEAGGAGGSARLGETWWGEGGELPDGYPAGRNAGVSDPGAGDPGAGDPLAGSAAAGDPTVEVPLKRLALARSGDKANTSNVAIIARHPAYVPLLRREVTARRMGEHFKGLVNGPVERFEAPGLSAFNFLMHDALGGGGMASLRIDPQGKAYGAMALEMLVTVPAALLASVEAGQALPIPAPTTELDRAAFREKAAPGAL